MESTYQHPFTPDPEPHGIINRIKQSFSWLVMQLRALIQRLAPKKAKAGKQKYYVSRESGRPLSDEEFNARRKAEKDRVDQILDKVSLRGYDSLTVEEKEFLFHYSQK